MFCKNLATDSEQLTVMSAADIAAFIEQIRDDLFSDDNLDALVDRVEQVNVKGEINLNRDVRDVIDNLINDRVQGLSKHEQVQAVRNELIEKLQDKVLERRISDSWRLIFPEHEVEEDVARFFGELDKGIQEHGVKGFGSLFMSLLVTSPVISEMVNSLLGTNELERYMDFENISQTVLELAEKLSQQSTVEAYKDVIGNILIYMGSLYFIIKAINGLNDNISFRNQADKNIEKIMRKYTHIKNYDVMLRTLDNLDSMAGHRRLTIKRKMLKSLTGARRKYTNRIRQSKKVYQAIKQFKRHQLPQDWSILIETEVDHLDVKINKKKETDLVAIITAFVREEISELYFYDSLEDILGTKHNEVIKKAVSLKRDYQDQVQAYGKLIKILSQKPYRWLEVASVMDNSSPGDISVITKKIDRRVAHTHENIKEIELRIDITKESKDRDQSHNELHRLQRLLEKLITKLAS